LANDRPIAYRGFDRGSFDRSRQTVRVLLSQLVEPPTDAAGHALEVDESQHLLRMRERLTDMQSQLAADDAARIGTLAPDVQDAVGLTEESRASQLQSVREELQEISSRNVEF